ncbi:DMT family transporter [Conexibacter arvalis]|uniref:Small multidrug resistance pump n=1 Tax=Conexibacter arvalis TaxID=912552 RepID=A0A840IBR9_9ACTN|nr:multidrug efflux SMR transporter [Conexibacter arvalis]MBB4662276.1 small multidrug resistance pump [Conexibacter arvalis]
MPYLLLAIAIAAEIAATSLMKETDGFTRPLPTVACLLGYGIAFALLAQAIKSMPVGVAYAMWAGIGTAAIAAVGAMFLGEPLTAAKVGGIVLVIAGVVMLNLGGAH